MDKADFKKINDIRITEGETPFANPRNAASGSLKLLDSVQVCARKLRCFIHSFGWMEGAMLDTHRAFLDAVRSWKLPVNPHTRYCRTLEEVLSFCREWQDKRDTLDYEVDGVVVKVNGFPLQRRLGATSRSPRWAVAYKFPAHQAVTRVEEIETGVGRTGIVTPVAILSPVECGGVVIKRATLHNFDEVRRLDVRKGDTVLIERAGDVIPKIVRVILSKRTGSPRKVTAPARCPVCGMDVIREKQGEVYWYCINPDCPARLKSSLFHFASRTAMDIEGFGERVIGELVDRGIVKGLADIYTAVTRDVLLGLPLFKEKKADRLTAAIRKSTQREFPRFLYGLGIRHVGEKAARVLAGEYRDIERFFTLTEEELTALPDIGPVVAASVVHFFLHPEVKKMIGLFRRAGLPMKAGRRQRSGDMLSGKIFVFTGELKRHTRAQARALVEQRGGKWTSSVSKRTDFVVAGNAAGSKYRQARELGVTVIGEDEFEKLISTPGHGPFQDG